MALYSHTQQKRRLEGKDLFWGGGGGRGPTEFDPVQSNGRIPSQSPVL